MTTAQTQTGQSELRAARRQSRGLFWAAALFSVFINLLMLTGPLFMLQIYDRVLTSRSEETLVSLTALIAGLFLLMGVLEHARAQVLARIGARLQARMEARVFAATLGAAAIPGQEATNGIADLDALQRLLAAKVFAALYDLPWTPVFLMGISLFHPLLGIMAMGGGVILIIVTALNQWLTRAPLSEAAGAGAQADRLASRLRTEAEMIRSVGMQANAFERWRSIRDRARDLSLSSSDRSGGFSTTARTFRMFLQSAILALGAWLVLQGQITPGAMIAASILLGRALAPIDLTVGQWPMVQRGLRGWRGVAALLDQMPEPPVRTDLPTPRAALEVRNLKVQPPGSEAPVLEGVSFRLEPGQAVGVIGNSGSGKSSLARALTGAWPIAGGTIRLDGAALEQYSADALARHIGYLPQRVQVFDGTVAENIARLSPKPDGEMVVRAARKAAAHTLITRLPQGYDTRLSSSSGQLSGGQLQRIGLARAMYGDPVLLVLDEPNSNLDNEGSTALNEAIREMKAAGHGVLIMAHRPAAIAECEMLIVMDGGRCVDFGPRDEVLRKVLKNHEKVVQSIGAGGRT